MDLGNEVVRVIDQHSKVLVFHYNALNAKEWMDFRYDMKQENITVKVYPNKLTCKFLESTRYKNMTVLFCSDTALAYSNEMNLKAVLKTLDANAKVALIGGKIDDVLMNRQQIVEYSKLPTLDQARAELVHILSQPSQTLSRLLQTNQTNLSSLLQGYVEQQTSGELQS